MATSPHVPTPYLAVENVSFAYSTGGHTVRVLSDFGFEVNEAEVVSLLGPSGCGKSTVLNVLSGLLSPMSGRVLLRGTAITGERTHTAYMFQDHSLLPWRTILQNVLLPAELDPAYGTPSARKIFVEKAEALLRAFGLRDAMHQHPVHLSGGMKQRAALARTFMANRPLYLFDEPFTGLDLFRRLRLEKMLAEFLEQERKTCLVVTHDLETAITLSHRVLLLEGNPCRVRRVINGMAGISRDTVKVRTTAEFREAIRQVMETLSDIFESYEHRP